MIGHVSKLFTFVTSFNMSFYAVARGRKIGVFTSWPECNENVKNFRAPKFKKFSTEAEAWEFVNKYSNSTSTNNNVTLSVGPEVPSEEPKSLISEFLSKAQILEHKQGKIIHDINEIKCHLQSLELDLGDIKRKVSRALNDDTSVQDGIKKLHTMDKDCEYYSIELGKIKDYMRKCPVPELANTCTSSLSSSETMGITSLNRTQILGTLNDSRKRKFSTSCPIYGGEDIKRMKCTNFNVSPETGFITNEEGFVEVYTDGACENNGKFRAKAGIGVWFGENHHLNISEPVKGRATNNMAEIQAASEAVNAAKKAGVTKLLIHTDSKFLIQCMSQWINKWKKSNWCLSTGQPVKNKEELIVLDKAIEGMVIKWNHVPGHRGVLGNERADELARNGALRYAKS